LLAKRIAEKLSLSQQQINDVAYAALICEIGLLGLDAELYSKPREELNYNQQKEYLEQINIAQLVFSPAAHLQEVSDIITCQFENINGSGPNQLSETQIPIGAKILAVARDYWRYAMGRILSEEMDYTATLKEMNKFLGTRYDSTVLDILSNNEDIVSDKFIEKPIASQDLKAGMVLKYSILTEAHILVLPEGHIFSDTTILKLIQFEKNQSKLFSLIVEENKEEI
jgi:response regulator RpfG family c-di-GMP phosphodiesterase